MPVNRSQASKVLSASEMTLFDAGSASGGKSLTAAQLKAKVDRTRKLRDKARDLYKRQRLSTRERTGSKQGRTGLANDRTRQKAQLLDELLKRLQAKLAKAGKTAGKKATTKKTAAKKATTKKTAGKKATGKKATGKKATGKKATGKKAAAKKTAGKKTAAKKTAAKKTAGKKTAGKKTAGKKTAGQKTAGKKVTAKKATVTKPRTGKSTTKTASGKTSAANRTTSGKGASSKAGGQGARPVIPPSEGLFGVPGLSPKAPVPIEPPDNDLSSKARSGFMSHEAKAVALDRHFAESRGPAIHGHISSAGRRNQGKRDQKG